MHLSKVNEALSHRIVGGSEYQWECYGYDSRFLDYESDFAHASVIFDTRTQEIYEATVNSKDESVRPYRWINPDYKEDWMKESKEKNIDPHIAWDNVKWVDLETQEDFLDKANAIFNDQDFDERVQVPLNLEKEELYRLMEMAHQRDITLNELVEDILWQVIDKKLSLECNE